MKYLTKSLEICSVATHRKDWAKVQNNLAQICRRLPVVTTNKTIAQIASGESAIVEKRIVHCKHVLEVVSATYEREMWMEVK